MTSFLKKLKLILRPATEKSNEEPVVDDILHGPFQRLHNIGSDTQQQWLRLQRFLDEDVIVAKPKVRMIPRFALAIVLLALASSGVYFFLSNVRVSTETFSTRRGEQKEVVLSDSSEVTLSYATDLVVLRYQTADHRRVSLRGEAYFRVRKAATPFVVATQFAEVQVVGTEFNVRTREGELEVAVLRGIVKVRATNDGRDSTILLAQNQMVSVPENGFPRRVEDISSAEYPGWMHSKIFLKNTSLPAACREIEMRFDVVIKIDAKVPQKDFITGVLDARTSENAIAALSELTGRKYTRDGTAYHIY